MAALQVLSRSSPTLIVKSCEPCVFEASVDLKFDVRFKPSGDRGVTQVEIEPVQPGTAGAKSPAVTQSFEIEDGWSPSGDFMLQGIDINFDGILDVAFGPILGTPNLTLEYWTVDAKRAKLDEIGKFTNLTVDGSKKQINTYEKGGHAGLLNESKSYRWEGGKLITVSENSQRLAPNGKDYVKTTRQFENGHVIEEKTKSVKPP